MTPTEVVFRLNDLVNSGEYDRIDELFAEDYVDHNSGWRVANVDELKRLMSMGRVTFDLRNEIEDVVASGDWVFVRVRNKGRHQGVFLGIAPTGKEASIATFEIYRFDNGKIKERWVESDTIGLLSQLGYQISIGG